MTNSIFKVRIKNSEYEVEIESSDRKFVDEKLKEYASVSNDLSIQKSESPQLLNVSLAKLLRDHNATVNQNRKFLGAAVYLSLKGNNSLKTADITLALREAGQTRIGNPSACLNENIKKGFIERNGSHFMVTVHGKEEFGISY